MKGEKRSQNTKSKGYGEWGVGALGGGGWERARERKRWGEREEEMGGERGGETKEGMRERWR